MRSLGLKQRAFIAVMGKPYGHKPPGVWHPGIGWTYGTVDATVKMLKSLVPHGLVKLDPEWSRSKGLGDYYIDNTYRLTPTGELVATSLEDERRRA